MSKFISYAQNFEDVILWRALSNIKSGCYIDIGANDPVLDSVSLAFYEHGWRGVHVEPVRAYADRLRASRPNEIVIEAAVSATRDAILLFDFPETGLSTSNVEVAAQHVSDQRIPDRVIVPTITLKEVMSRSSGREIHWLKIDVEGAEADVLASWQDSEARPWIVIVEATLPNSQIASFADWEAALTSRGYAFAHFDGLNRFYVHEAHAELSQKLALPPNYFDYFAMSEHSPFVVGLRAARINAEKLTAAADRRALEVQESAAAVDQHYRSLSREADNLRGHIERKDGEIARLARELAVADQRLQESFGIIQKQATAFQASLVRITHLHAEAIAETETKAERLNKRLDDERKSSEEISAKLLEATHREQSMLQRAAAHEGQIEQLALQVSQLNESAEHHKATAAAMRRSMSWQVSTPVRLVGMTGRYLARAILSIGLNAVRRFPRLKKWVLKSSKGHPALQRRLGQLAQATPPNAAFTETPPLSATSGVPEVAVGVPLVTADESFSVRLIYSNVAKASQLRRSV